MNSAESPDRSYWESWRLGVWAVGLSVVSVTAQLEYVVTADGIGPLQLAVLLGSIFRVFFLLIVFYRLYRTPEPQPGASAWESGHGLRGVIVHACLALGLAWHVMYFFGFLEMGVWVGMITSLLWMVWLRGMAIREMARCGQLENETS